MCRGALFRPCAGAKGKETLRMLALESHQHDSLRTGLGKHLRSGTSGMRALWLIVLRHRGKAEDGFNLILDLLKVRCALQHFIYIISRFFRCVTWQSEPNTFTDANCTCWRSFVIHPHQFLSRFISTGIFCCCAMCTYADIFFEFWYECGFLLRLLLLVFLGLLAELDAHLSLV